MVRDIKSIQKIVFMGALLILIVCLGLSNLMKEQFYRGCDDDDDYWDDEEEEDDDEKCSAPNYLNPLYGYKVALPIRMNTVVPPVMPPLQPQIPPVQPQIPPVQPQTPDNLPRPPHQGELNDMTKEERQKMMLKLEEELRQRQLISRPPTKYPPPPIIQHNAKRRSPRSPRQQPPAAAAKPIAKQEANPIAKAKAPPPDSQPAGLLMTGNAVNPYPGGEEDIGTCKEVPFSASANPCELFIKKANAKATTDCKAKTTITFGEISNRPFINPDGSSLTPKQKSVMMAFENGKLWMPGDKADDKRSQPSTPDIVQNEAAMAKHFQSVMKGIWDFCEKDPKYKKDSRWLNLKRYWPLAIVFYDSKNAPGKAAFFQIVKDPPFTFVGISTNPSVNTNIKDEKLKATQTAILLHELGHSSQGLHNEEWRNAYMFLVNIATFHLGIKVHLHCNECMEFGICNKLMAPKSDFEDICHCFQRPDGSVIETQRVWARYGA
jgi:hypothetical protein